MAAWRRVERIGRKDREVSLGVMFLNWTQPGDEKGGVRRANAPVPPAGFGGDHHVDVTLDPRVYNLQGLYDIYEVVPSGVAVKVGVFDTRTPTVKGVWIPERNLRFFYLQKPGLDL